MVNYFEIDGSITYKAMSGSPTLKFNYISKLHIMKNPNMYYVYVGGENLYKTSYTLDINNEDTEIILNGKRYFGKALHDLYIELQNLETEKALEELE